MMMPLVGLATILDWDQVGYRAQGPILKMFTINMLRIRPPPSWPWMESAHIINSFQEHDRSYSLNDRVFQLKNTTGRIHKMISFPT